MGASGTSSLHARCEGPLGIPLQSLPGPASPFAVEARISGFLSSVDKDLGVPLGFPQGIRPHIIWRHARPLSSGAGKVVLGFLSG